MKILSFSTSSEYLSVCLSENEKLLAEVNMLSERSHSTELLLQIDHVLKLAGTEKETIDAFVCDIGPGSFTGIRIGVSAANAMAAVTGKPVAGISSLEGLAFTVSAYCQFVCPVIYAKHDQVYAALYRNSEPAGAYYAGGINEYLGQLKDIGTQNILFTGNGIIAFREKIQEVLGGRALFAGRRQLVVSAGGLAAAAIRKNVFANGPVSPLYLKDTRITGRKC